MKLFSRSLPLPVCLLSAFLMTGETLHTSTVNWTGHGSSLHSIESEDAYPGNGIYGEEQSEPETNDGNETGSDGESPEDPQ